MAERGDYTACAEYERHFNTLQAGIRGLASAWILAVFAGFSVLLQQNKDVAWLLPAQLLIALMAFMASVGLVLLWTLDQLIYQRLLSSVFLTGFQMERLNPDLPPTRALMIHALSGSVTRLVRLFYASPCAFFTVVTVIAAYAALGGQASQATVLSPGQRKVVLVLAVLQALLLVWMVWKSKQVGGQSQVVAFGKELETAYADPDARRRLIQRNSEQLVFKDDQAGRKRSGALKLRELRLMRHEMRQLRADLLVLEVRRRRRL